MKKNRILKLIFMLLLLIGLVGISSIFTIKTKADGNTVYLKDRTIEANDSGIIVAEIVGEGKANDDVNIFIHTEGGTAIPGLDYVSVNTLIRASYGSDGKLSYPFSIKTLVTPDSREKIRTYDQDNKQYGRYFNLVIEKATNATVVTDSNKNTSQCYLPYNHKAEIVTGQFQDKATRDNVPYAYFKDYSYPLTQYDDGKNSLDGKSSWRTWKEGMTFNNETTANWINVFINQGIASAYGSFSMLKVGDHSGWTNAGDTHIYIKYGNKELIEKMNGDYDKNDQCPGTALFIKLTTVSYEQKFFWSSIDYKGEEIQPKSMKYIIVDDKNPYKQDDETIDVDNTSIKTEGRTLRWFQQTDEWYADKNSFIETGAVKIEPYNGVLDTGLAVFNDNKEFDIDVRKVHEYLSLVDSKTPEILGEFVDDSELKTNNKLKIYIRFNEPVMIDGTNGQGGSNWLPVYFNGSSSYEPAYYVEGNYTDTLVFEVEPPQVNIRDIKYQLPTDLIGDLAYNLDEYKVVQNNRFSREFTDKDRTLTFLNGAVNLLKPTLAIDQASSPSANPHNIYNILLSINNNGEKDIKDGTLYYTFDTTEEWVKEGTTTPLTAEELTNTELYKNTHVFTPEENGSLPLTLVKNEAEGIPSGVYYLHALAVSGYGLTDVKTFGPYNLDGDPPTANQLPPDPNTLKEKTYKLDLTNKATEVDNIFLKLSYIDKNGAAQEKLIDVVKNGANANQSKVVITAGTDNTIYTYASNISDAEIQEILTANNFKRIEFNVTFNIEDVAGNKTATNMIKAIYDSRDLFASQLDVPLAQDQVKGYTKINDIDVSAGVYDLSTIGTNALEKDIYIDFIDNGDNASAKADIEAGAIFSIIINGETTINADEGNKFRVTLTDLKPGFYDIVPKITGTVNNTQVDRVSNNIQFYITNNKQDMTANKEAMSKDLVLSNKVFQIQDQQYYYLADDSTTVISYPYGATYDSTTKKAQGGSTYPTFSNVNEAKKYIKFMELQDLYLVKLTPTQANLLNSGSTTTAYAKAAGESITAQEGQLWIRYKKSTWENTANAYGWAYYYYGNGNLEDGINVNALPTNLTNAMNDVVNRISNTGKIVYLVEEENLNQSTGAPYLASTQIHVELEEASTNKIGLNTFASPAKYDGDKEIYKNTVKEKIGDTEVEYALATNLVLKITPSTRLFYQYSPTDDPNNKIWKEIFAEDGMKLSEVLPSQTSGPYLIREYNDAGVSEYNIYYDKSIPNLSVVIGSDPMVLDGTVLRYSSDAFIIKGFTASTDYPAEIDDMAYVALYSYPGKKLEEVLYASDFANGDKKLEERNYYVQVGDRSGNIATYIVLLSNSELQVDVAENDSKTSVIVKVYDREDNEIYSYEVYCNEVLVTTEYAATNYFKEPGIYRVKVADIYGNEVTKTAEFAFKIPDINWYYLQSDDSYGKYNPDNIVSMAIYDDPNNSRITNVYTAAMLKIQFVTVYGEDPVQFEVLDLATDDYSYYDRTETITINKLAGFRLRVWYESLPQNDHTFVVIVDNEAPTIKASFIGKTLSAYQEQDADGKVIKTAAFDKVNLENYNEGDTLCLDTLAYVIDSNESEKTFENGDVISGGHIVLAFQDPSEIKSFKISRNDQPIEMELDNEQKLIINNVGYYEVTVSDMLGNIRKFTFTNTSDPITVATIDDANLPDSVKTYGHSNINVKYLYPGENRILIETPKGKETLVFTYDEQYVKYGTYVCAIEKTQDESGQIVETKVAEYKENTDFAIDITDSNTRLNNWYTAIEHDYYVISIMIGEDKKPTLKLELKEVEDANNPVINVEILYNAGNTVIPSYYIASLSVETPVLKLYSGFTEVIIKEGSNYIYVSDILNIDPKVGPNISTISFGFSEKPEFGDLEIIYENGKFTKPLLGFKEGFYKIVATNVFNNKTEYLVCKVDSFKTIVEVVHFDGTKIEYLENEGVFYSNSRINFNVYSDSAEFEVDGEEYSGVYDSGIITLEVYKQGEHTVSVIGSNGVREDFHINISTDPQFIFHEEWLTGYTENALLKDQGYTSTPLTPTKPDGVEYIAYKYAENEIKVIYDNISENKKLDQDELFNSIGNDGDGDYTVYFKNIFGDSSTKTIHFSDNPALTLSRKTVDENSSFATYDLIKAMENGFYSNYILRFETSSMKYEFKIDDAIVSLDEPKTLEFSNASGNGSFEYKISYLDEYGNYLEFMAHLYRTDVSIDTTLMKEIDVDNKKYTKDNVIVMFGDELTGYVSVENGDRKPYESGTTFYKDGRYEFIVEDIAGNRNTYVINHKSINHYTLTNSLTQGQVIMGSVINNASVLFQATDDSKITKVFKNSQLVDNYETNTFTTTGHWEILIEDTIGNQSYAGFYIISNPLISFEYQAPFDYEITEIWLTRLDGRKEAIEPEKDKPISLTENGDYVVVVTSTNSTTSFNFTVTINTTPPTATLSGVEDGGVTARNVSLKGLKNGDVVEIYRDGKLISTTDISVSNSAPEIVTGGNYKIVIKAVSGAQIEYSFTRKQIANTATSVFIIVACLVVIAGIGIGLLYHTKIKNDSEK